MRFRLLLLFLSIISVPLVAQAPKPMAAAAKEPFDKGLIAAQQQEWDLAIKYFSQAQAADVESHSPAILFNLGLAHAKAGHEVAAIYWLHAYLAAAPDAPNSDQVKVEIQRLTVATDAKIQRIFQTALAGAAQCPSEGRDRALSTIAYYQARSGDLESALATNSRMSNSDAARMSRNEVGMMYERSLSYKPWGLYNADTGTWIQEAQDKSHNGKCDDCEEATWFVNSAEALKTATTAKNKHEGDLATLANGNTSDAYFICREVATVAWILAIELRRIHFIENLGRNRK